MLRIDLELVKELSLRFRLDDGEHPLELLPELQELTISGSGDVKMHSPHSSMPARTQAALWP